MEGKQVALCVLFPLEQIVTTVFSSPSRVMMLCAPFLARVRLQRSSPLLGKACRTLFARAVGTSIPSAARWEKKMIYWDWEGVLLPLLAVSLSVVASYPFLKVARL